MSSPEKREYPGNRIVIAGSNDLALELLTKSVQMRSPDLTLSLSNTGSLAGLFALQRGTCHIAASHLLDTETGEYNSSYILIIPNQYSSTEAISALFQSLNSDDLRAHITHLGGYEMQETDKVMYEA
jgi:molybdate-binding protein